MELEKGILALSLFKSAWTIRCVLVLFTTQSDMEMMTADGDAAPGHDRSLPIG